MSQAIYHLATFEDAEKLAQSGSYTAASLATEGFIHCCTAGQLPGVLQRYYADAQRLVVLHINSDQLESRLVMENTVGGSEDFPHVYGPINASAITRQTEIDAERIREIAASPSYEEA